MCYLKPNLTKKEKKIINETLDALLNSSNNKLKSSITKIKLQTKRKKH
ncbi:MAG: hypothetical protein [Microvirus sp.]|nr:MAG: hypothetical protein [Microvirus sp.]